MGQCDPPATQNDWLFAICCLPCASAVAKSNVDQSHPFYNFLCWTPVGVYSFVRMAYGIQGVCGDDLCYGIWCSPCATRRVYTESKTRGQLQGGAWGRNNGQWQKSLFNCTTCEFCESVVCVFCVSHEVRVNLQPEAAQSCWFDTFCVPPPAMYGQVRHTYGIQSDCDLCEDIFLPIVCMPCALNRARGESSFHKNQGSAGGMLKNALGVSPAQAQMIGGYARV